MSELLVVAFAIVVLFWLGGMLVSTGVIKGGPIRKWHHDKLRWHDGNGPRWFDGCSVHSTCSQCGEEVMQDSQGNWF